MWGRIGASLGPTIASMESSVVLRLAAAADEKVLLRWANDPETRRASLRSETIDPATHAAWFASRLADPDGRLWIGLVDDQPIGQLRIERTTEGDGEVSIAVAPEARGRGLSRPLLLAGLVAAREELGVRRFVALVRQENDRSLALFRGAGFHDAGETVRAGVRCRVFIHDD